MSNSEKQDIIYFNHAGTSWPKPAAVAQAIGGSHALDPLQWPESFLESFTTLADFFHVGMKRLLLTPSCTTALNLAIADHDWKMGDRILTSNFEHHALYRNLMKLNPLGVKTSQIPPDNDSPFNLTILETELRKGRVKLVAITAACNVTGVLLPIEAVNEIAHQFGAKVLVDGAQVAGWWNLNLASLGVDLFTFAGHKGTQAPWGVGGLYVSKKTEMYCESASCNLESKLNDTDLPMPSYCDAGSVNLPAVAGLAAGCRWLNCESNKDRLEHARGLAHTFTESIRELPGIQVIQDFDCAVKMPTVAVVAKDIPATPFFQTLRERGVVCSGGFQCSPESHKYLKTEKHGVARFSFGAVNTEAEVHHALEIISSVLAE